jgi:hypothetical protein
MAQVPDADMLTAAMRQETGQRVRLTDGIDGEPPRAQNTPSAPVPGDPGRLWLFTCEPEKVLSRASRERIRPK